MKGTNYLNTPKVIVVAGPTASGKTTLGIDLALKFNGEIISADSRQVYRGLDIGSGKVTKKESRGVKHHLIDIVEPGDKYSVYQFQKDCQKKIEEITAMGNLPIIVGGTGLYIESIIEQYKFSRFSWKSKRSTKRLGLRPNILVLNLNPDREVIKTNIQKRLKERWQKEGMLEEVQQLIDSGVNKDWLKSLGLEYRFITQYIDGEFDHEEEMLEKLNTASWQFAKRQITFIKRWNYAKEVKSSSEAVLLVESFLS